MLASFTPTIKQLLPPVAISVARRMLRRGPPDWEYLPDGWRDAQSGGWQDPSIAETQQRKWTDFMAVVNGAGPLGVAHEAAEITDDDLCAHNVLLAYGYVLARAARRRDELSLLDWGGGIGHYAAIAKALVPELPIRYTVKDLPELCRVGRQNLPDVRFESEADRCFERQYDLVFASCSIHYEKNWRQLLAQLAACSKEWLYVTRLPTVSQAETFAVVQRPFAYGYDTEYVSWVFNRRDFLDQAASLGLKLERELLLSECPYVVGAPEQFEGRGFLFRVARSATP